MDSQQIQAALSCIPAHDHDTWVKMGMAIKSELGEAGYPIWNDWSQSADNYRERDAQTRWRSFKPDGKVTAGTLFHEAKQRGYKPNGTYHKPTPAELDHQKRERAERAAKAAAELSQQHARARDQAQEIWKRCKPVEVHEYATAKGIKPTGARLYSGPLIINGSRCDGALTLAIVGADGVIDSLQFITPQGKKLFLPNGAIAGHYFSAGDPGRGIVIAEGYATAASIREATGQAIAVAFNAGNLGKVAAAIRAKLPDAQITIAGDNDQWTEGNPGTTKAREAAHAIGASLVIPKFADLAGKPTDFNDLHQREGLDAVRAQIEKAAPIARADESTGPAPNASGINYRKMADIEAKPINWLWPGRIARGKVSMIAGHPGLGKSQITISLAAIVSTGGLWPVDRTKAERGNVIFLSAEDEPSDTIRPRLEAAGADLDRIYMLDAVRIEGDNGEATQRGFSLKTDLSRLGAMLGEIGDVALIIIDPITAYMGGVETHYNADVRAALAPLSDLAADHGAAVVCVSHLNKGGGNSSDALMRVTGSIAFVAAARAAYLVVKDEDSAQRRLFLPLKNNNGDDKNGLAFELRPYQIPSGIDTCRVMWETQPVTITADQALAVQTGDRSEIDEAMEFLLGELKTENWGSRKVPSKQIEQDAQANGISSATLRRAKKALGIKAVHEGQPSNPDAPGKWYWQLPDQSPKMLKNPEDAQDNNVSAFGENERLREPEPGTGADEVVI